MPPSLLRQLAEAKARRELLDSVRTVAKEKAAAKPPEKVDKVWEMKTHHREGLQKLSEMSNRISSRMKLYGL